MFGKIDRQKIEKKRLNMRYDLTLTVDLSAFLTNPFLA